METTFINTEDPRYQDELELRFRVLREPLGHPRAQVAFPFESESMHLIAERDERVLGCVLFHPETAQQGRLFQMAVDPGSQGQGVGRLLLRELEVDLRRRGFTRVHVHARVESVGFYEREGYAIEGEPFTEVGIPHRHMAKLLG